MLRKESWQLLAAAVGIVASAMSIYAVVELLTEGRNALATSVLLAVAIALLLICVRIWQITSRIHPWIKKYYVTTIIIDNILEKVNNDVAFILELGGEPRRIKVSPEPVSDPDAEIIIVGEDGESERSAFDQVFTYAGSVVGEEESSVVRLTITPEMLGGYVMEAENWWFIEPLVKFQAEAPITDYLVYRTKDLQFKLTYGNDLVRRTIEQFDPGSLPPGSGYIGEPPPGPKQHKVGPDIGIAMVADKEYYEGNKWTKVPWYIHQTKILNEVNGLYKKNIGYQFLAKVWIMDAKTMTSTNGDVLLHQLKTVVENLWANLYLVVERMKYGTEVAHLTSGKDLDGKLLGLAESWTNNKSQGLGGIYSLSQQFIEPTISFMVPTLACQNMMVMAHELGHSFNAIHEQSVEWCVTYFIWCWDKERSLMWHAYYNDNKDWISDGVYKKGYNNRQRIINNATHFRTYDFK